MNKRGFQVKQESDVYPRHQPEAVLALAVIQRAINDVLYEDCKIKPNPKAKYEAMRWLGLTEELSPYERSKQGSFSWWCGLVGLSESYIALLVKKIMHDKDSKKTRRRVASVA